MDLLFKPVAVVKVSTGYRGSAIRCATEAESAEVKADHASISFGREPIRHPERLPPGRSG